MNFIGSALNFIGSALNFNGCALEFHWICILDRHAITNGMNIVIKGKSIEKPRKNIENHRKIIRPNRKASRWAHPGRNSRHQASHLSRFRAWAPLICETVGQHAPDNLGGQPIGVRPPSQRTGEPPPLRESRQLPQITYSCTTPTSPPTPPSHTLNLHWMS